jgi:hypothetical protein
MLTRPCRADYQTLSRPTANGPSWTFQDAQLDRGSPVEAECLAAAEHRLTRLGFEALIVEGAARVIAAFVLRGADAAERDDLRQKNNDGPLLPSSQLAICRMVCQFSLRLKLAFH